MDDANADPAEVARAFRFIRAINRHLGGTSSLLRVWEKECLSWPRDRPMHWLDLGTGAADIPLAVDDWARRRGLRVTCVALDRMAASLTVARAAVGSHPRIRVEEGDAFTLDRDFAAGSFDYVHAGLFLHHLPDDQVPRVLRSMGQLATRSVIWNDLLRTRQSAVAIRLLTLACPRFVRDDARLSVAKGFLPDEARALAHCAGLSGVTLRHRPLVGRFVLTAAGGVSPVHECPTAHPA